MMKMALSGLLFGAVLLSSGEAGAIVLGGTNLGGFAGYPEADCEKPRTPSQPSPYASRFDIEMYNSQVRRYNLELQMFLDCTKRYLDNAKNDLDRIRERMDEAVERAKR